MTFVAKYRDFLQALLWLSLTKSLKKDKKPGRYEPFSLQNVYYGGICNYPQYPRLDLNKNTKTRDKDYHSMPKAV